MNVPGGVNVISLFSSSLTKGQNKLVVIHDTQQNDVQLTDVQHDIMILKTEFCYAEYQIFSLF
jgi:hypothetical protein